MEIGGIFFQVLGVLTAGFLILFIGLELAGFAESWAPVIRTGLLASGVPWLILAIGYVTGFVELAWLIPLVYLAIGSFWAKRFLRRRQADHNLKKSGGWRCPRCRTENEANSSVCYYCQDWRPGR